MHSLILISASFCHIFLSQRFISNSNPAASKNSKTKTTFSKSISENTQALMSPLSRNDMRNKQSSYLDNLPAFSSWPGKTGAQLWEPISICEDVTPPHCPIGKFKGLLGLWRFCSYGGVVWYRQKWGLRSTGGSHDNRGLFNTTKNTPWKIYQCRQQEVKTKTGKVD